MSVRKWYIETRTPAGRWIKCTAATTDKEHIRRYCADLRRVWSEVGYRTRSYLAPTD